MENKKIILLAGKSDSTNILYHNLNDTFGIYKVVLEQKPSTSKSIKRKIYKNGFGAVVGQILFKATVAPFLKLSSGKRVHEILKQHQLNSEQIPPDKIIDVDSVNSEATFNLLKEINPDLIIVHGTTILSSKLLDGLSCKFMNIHAGITPKYRGVHGGYWALANNDQMNCGVTVHLIDKGIDTGDIIAQDTISLTSADNFYTYPYLQLAKGIELLTKAIKEHFDDKLITKKAAGESVLRHHPTIWQYLYNRWRKKVK